MHLLTLNLVAQHIKLSWYYFGLAPAHYILSKSSVSDKHYNDKVELDFKRRQLEQLSLQ